MAFEGLKFYLRECVRLSLKTAFRAVNGLWGTIFGVGAVALLGPIIFMGGISKTAQTINGIGTVAIYAAVAWFTYFFLHAIFVAPFLLYVVKQKRINDLEALLTPDVSWQLMDGLIHSSGTSQVCLVEINNGSKALNNCRINLDNYIICVPFSLIPGEKKHIQILKIASLSDTMTIVPTYFFKDGNWQRHASAPIIHGDENHKLQLLAENLHPPLEMTINVSVSKGWKIQQIEH